MLLYNNSPVTCFPKQSTGATPRLTDGVLGPDSLTSPTTDYAYTLAGTSQFGLFETWIQFYFASYVSLASVTLHYYCTGQSPQLQLNDGSAVVAQRQCLAFNFGTGIKTVVILKVLRNNNTMYISEVKFFEGQPHFIKKTLLMRWANFSAHIGSHMVVYKLEHN